MNYCRICKKIIPERFNQGPALRCSECRAKKDEELAELIDMNHSIDADNDLLRCDCINATNKMKATEYQNKKIKKRYELLRQRHSVVLNDNRRLNKENEKLSKGVERLFAKIDKLENLEIMGKKVSERIKDDEEVEIHDRFIH